MKAVPVLALAPGLLAQQRPVSIPVSKLHHFGLRVSDVSRSLDFYQGLFGAPVLARQGETVCLQIGDGPYFFSLSPTRAGEPPAISQIGISVPDFNPDRVSDQLVAHGIDRGPSPASGQSRRQAVTQTWIRSRDPDEGGDVDGTRELLFTDPDGILYQLCGPAYCGGAGPLGNRCDAIEPASADGLLQLHELSHFTNRVASAERANRFHRNLFGLGFQAYQGPNAPVIGVGDGIQFLMYIGGAQESGGEIDHVCLSVQGFDVDRILSELTDYGLTSRGDNPQILPLVHYISLRMPNRGGVEGGTPELYFSDPDGLRIQLQDPGYCGGGGYLGDACEPL